MWNQSPSRLEHDYGSTVTLIGIASNSLTTHPQDGPEGLRHSSHAARLELPLPAG